LDLKILQINNQHFIKGGAHRVYFETGKLLEENGHEVYYFSQKSKQNLENKFSEFWPEENNYRHLSFIGKTLSIKHFVYNKDAFNKLSEFIDYFKPDIAHVHLYMGGLTSSILQALKYKNVPIIHSAHDYRLICPSYLMIDAKNNICERCKGNKYYNCILQKCSENNIFQSTVLCADAYYRKLFINPIDLIDRFIFVSEFQLNKHLEFNNNFRKKSNVLYNFIKDFSDNNLKTKKGDYILFVGRLSKEKGIDILIEASKKLNLKLKIAGSGPLLNYFKNDRNIEFLGYKNKEDIIDLIIHSKFLVIPSICYENNPMTVIEAFSLGKPVIGSRIGGIPELINDGENGFLFEAGNVEDLQNVIEKANSLEDNMYFKMSDNAWKFASDNFDSKKYYHSLMKIYKDVISNYKK
jgi:glycosyltransferase involved in cell wall biosynthesis